VNERVGIASRPSPAQGLLDRYYPEENGQRSRDTTAPFYQWILSGIDAPHAVVLNIGAGPTPTASKRRLRGRFQRLVGVDPDPVVLTNDDLDEAHIAEGSHLPFPDEHFDAVYSDWTVEHVADPRTFFGEASRVLKPGGSFWFRTPNLYHYVTLAAVATPHSFHTSVVNRARGYPKGSHEPWPTFYRANTRSKLRRVLTEAGFAELEIRMAESYPTYLMFHRLAFRLGMVYERLVNRWEALSGFRHYMLVRATRPAGSGRSQRPA